MGSKLSYFRDTPDNGSFTYCDFSLHFQIVTYLSINTKVSIGVMLTFIHSRPNSSKVNFRSSRLDKVNTIKM